MYGQAEFVDWNVLELSMALLILDSVGCWGWGEWVGGGLEGCLLEDEKAAVCHF